ncbi:unnamed protein product [Acanthoscelides obtectus]|uniref:CDGSH iron-sulfur domain-containing protein 2 homologue n=1 Tax=Acanthoscelides obtectus TaxID=200917 RepID=A0A9P0Q6G9_ACAOB|nr:unnamed protein product [Acanthoscelides obtectus]CAK1636277.1 CDGSH iron-sulfur domain-containing protein 2 homolog [Acanthoscelides obtectus]
MQPLAHLVKVSLPEYLASLPIPDTVGGWFRLGIKDWAALIPPTALLAGVTYISYRAFCPEAHKGCAGASKVNVSVLKSQAKVVDTIDVEDISEKAVLCRCWRSKNWPYCDGSHNDHNKQTGDNVGPLIVKKEK